MRRDDAPICGFRRRLLRAIEAQCDGKYSVLAQRAGIPVSTLEHYLHHAKHLPGGEPLLRMADALGVPVGVLMAGEAAGRGTDPTALPTPMRVPRKVAARVRSVRPLALPVFRTALAEAPLVRPVARLRADRILRQVLRRVAEVNRKPYYRCRVTAVGVFGEYLTDAPLLADLDLASGWSPRNRARGNPLWGGRRPCRESGCGWCSWGSPGESGGVAASGTVACAGGLGP